MEHPPSTCALQVDPIAQGLADSMLAESEARGAQLTPHPLQKRRRTNVRVLHPGRASNVRPAFSAGR